MTRTIDSASAMVPSALASRAVYTGTESPRAGPAETSESHTPVGRDPTGDSRCRGLGPAW